MIVVEIERRHSGFGDGSGGSERKRGAHDPAPPPPGSGAAQRLGKGEAASRDGVVGVKMNGKTREVEGSYCERIFTKDLE